MMETVRGRYPAMAVAILLVALAACGRPDAMGDMNVVIVGVPDAAWPALADDVQERLESRVFVGQDERIFRVTQVDPTGDFWGDTRRLRNVVVAGEPGDEWVAEVLRRADGQQGALPALVEAHDVWARGQRVYALVVPPGSSVAAAEPLVPQLHASMLDRYHTALRQRMFASGVDTARISAVERAGGFRLIVPRVYRMEEHEAGTFQFINDQPDPARLQRSVLVTPLARQEAELSETAAVDARGRVAERLYDPPQVTHRDRIESAAVDGPAAGAVEARGQWSSAPGSWPAGGPFVSRIVACADGRAFLLDGWVYAPGREKYEYVLQVTQIMDSFECSPPAG
jgi:hypothetical protein